MKKIPRLLILGGGYVTFTAVAGLKKAIGSEEMEVTVVTKDNFQIFHGFIGEMLTGRISPGNILSPVRRIFSPANIQIGVIEDIDLAAKKVRVHRKTDGSHYSIEYDYLLFALGTQENLDMYPGLREHGFRLKRFDDCFRLRNHILKMFELASITDDPDERRAMLTFFVAGGGYSGCEVAGEISDLCRLLTAREYRHLRRDECRVVLVCSAATILPELHSGTGAAGYGDGHPKLVEYATKHSLSLGVEIRTETRVTAATPSQVHLSSGEIIPTHTIISAVGTKAHEIVAKTRNLPVNKRGKIIVDATMQVDGFEDVWAAGDCAAVPSVKGGFCPPVAIFAIKHGEVVGKNILRKRRGVAQKPFGYVALGQGVSIGKRTAVAEVKGIPIRGFMGWVVWRVLLFYYFPSIDRKMRLLADWIIWLFAGRDIVEMTTEDSDDYELKHNLYQPGEVILSEAKGGRYLHIITDGEVEIFAHEPNDGQPFLVKTLKTGDRFGQEWFADDHLEFAKAAGVVKTVSVSASQSMKLEALFGNK